MGRNPQAVSKYQDQVGRRFGRLVALEFSRKEIKVFWKFRCDCGAIVHRDIQTVLSRNTSSCGCLRIDVARGVAEGCPRRPIPSQSPIYRRWQAMRKRCTNPKARGYKNYGGRGIKVCERWQRFENFVADMGDPLGEVGNHTLEIDRIDSDGDYEPGNCRWIPRSENQANRRRPRAPYSLRLRLPSPRWAGRDRERLREEAAKIGLTLDGLKSRIRRGWSLEKALNIPRLQDVPRGPRYE